MLAPAADQVGPEGDRRHGRELGPGEADHPARQPGEQEPLAAERQQHQQGEEDAEGGRVGVGEDEVEGGARESDRRQDRGGEERRQGAEELPAERVEGAEDRHRLHQAEGEGGGEPGAEEGERTGQRVDAGRAVEVADVAVGLRAAGNRVGHRQLVAGVDRWDPPLLPAQRGEDCEHQGQAGERPQVRGRRQPAGPIQRRSRPAAAGVGRANGYVHADAGRTAPTSSRICRGASLEVSRP